jgi:hypothetical protein
MWTYKSVDVYPADRNSSGIRWYARTHYGILRADTRDGMRHLISNLRKSAFSNTNPRRRYRRNSKRSLQVWDKHQLKIARDTLKMSDAGARIMGGMTKEEARRVILRLTGRKARENPRRRHGKKRRYRSRR